MLHLKPGYFFRTPFILPWLYPRLTWRIPTQAKELYLTFDDGPVSGPTEFVLDQLLKVNARGTFFSIGSNLKKHPDVFRRILEHGHGVGNHTFNHLSGWKTGIETYVEDVNLCTEELRKHLPAPGNQQPANDSPLFRPPYGRITRSQIRALEKLRIVMWDVLTNDYARNLSPERCLRGSLAAARPGSIVVFHDSFKAERNMMYALPRFLEHFGSLGYSFKTLI